MAIVRIPALIDPHVHMVTSDPQAWWDFSMAAKKAGYVGLQIMPDLDPPITDKMSYAHYEQMAKESVIPLYLTAAGTAENIEALKQLRLVNAVKVWLGTGPEDLVVTKEEELRKILLSTDKVVMIHAEDESTLLRNFMVYHEELTLERHGDIFDRISAVRATIKAITASKETGRRVYLCHISTGEEVELVRQAKAKGIRIYAEVAPHHLFLSDSDMDRLGTFGKVNPPLRPKEDQRELWRGITDGTIDTIGSDTTAWFQDEKEDKYDAVPSGFPNLELTLPLLLTAMKEKKITLQRIMELTSINPARIFNIPKPTRSLFVDIDTPRMQLSRISDWHPYNVDTLVGWPIRMKDQKSAR